MPRRVAYGHTTTERAAASRSVGAPSASHARSRPPAARRARGVRPRAPSTRRSAAAGARGARGGMRGASARGASARGTMPARAYIARGVPAADFGVTPADGECIGDRCPGFHARRGLCERLGTGNRESCGF